MTPLRQRMMEDMQLRNFTSETQRTYVHHIYDLARFYQTSPDLLGLEDLCEYQVYLVNGRLPVPGIDQSVRLRSQVFLHGYDGGPLARIGAHARPRPPSTTHRPQPGGGSFIFRPRSLATLPGRADDRLRRGSASF